jgi:glycosyltransferase involved in cell wall biosynthesis
MRGSPRGSLKPDPGTLVLTPGIRGDDGLSLLSREVAGALRKIQGESNVQVWSLTDDPHLDDGIRSAGGSRLQFVAWAMAEGWAGQRGRRVVTLHAHLLPVALPLVQRGAHLIHLVVGIDAWKPLTAFQAAALRRAWRVAAISHHSAAEFRRANPWYPGIGIPICHPGLPDLEDEPSTVDGSYALIVGRMSREERYKGHDLLIEQWNELRVRVPRAELVVVGGGDDRPRLEEKSKSLGLGNAVRFLGKVPGPELRRLYRECAFFVMPSRREGFGFVFLEAMRAGKACIGARGAADEIIEDGVTGHVVDLSDPQALLGAMEKLWSHRERRAEMGASGRCRFQALFTRDRFEERFRELLREG